MIFLFMHSSALCIVTYVWHDLMYKNLSLYGTLTQPHLYKAQHFNARCMLKFGRHADAALKSWTNELIHVYGEG